MSFDFQCSFVTQESVLFSVSIVLKEFVFEILLPKGCRNDDIIFDLYSRPIALGEDWFFRSVIKLEFLIFSIKAPDALAKYRPTQLIYSRISTNEKDLSGIERQELVTSIM